MFLSNLAQGRCREPVPSSFLPPFRARALPSRMPSLPNRRASWKGQKPPLPRNFGTRPLHPNIIWHSIKGKGERIRREEEARRGLAWPQLCLALSLFLSLRGVLHGAWCQLLFGAVVGPVVGLSDCLSAGQQSRRRRWRAWRWHAIVARLTRSHSDVRTDHALLPLGPDVGPIRDRDWFRSMVSAFRITIARLAACGPKFGC